MARGSIIRAAKSIPGGARPTPAPQTMAAPYQGSVSPLAAQLDSGGAAGTWGGAYQGYLPRPSDDFTNGAFGPFSPILPVPVDAPEPGTEFPDPRLYEYQVGWNLPVGQPGSEGIKLADFNTLRTLADVYSVARACIQLRKSEIRAIEWDILPTTDASKAMRSDRAAMKDFGSRRAEAMKFFKRPDPDFFSWSTFIDAFLEEVFVFDALSLLIRKKWMKGKGKGLLGSDLDSLSLISGPTIRPLRDMHGATPRPPAPAYQQYLYGVPRCDLMTLMRDQDIEQGDLAGAELGQYKADQLLYLPMVPRRWTPYGFPPIERALVPVMSGLQKQGFQLDYFREGTVPAVYISPGAVNANMTPNQIRELQDALNAIAGDPAWKHKIIVLPAGSEVLPQRQQQLADQFDEVVMNQVCMAFDVMPAELGIMPKVSTTASPGAANQMSKMTQGVHERKATKPTLTFIADIMNTILQEVCGQDDMRFMFEGLEEEEDEAAKTEMIVAQVSAGLLSIDEGREELSKQPWGLPETSDPGWATPTGGFVPLPEATVARQTNLAAGPVMNLPPGAKVPPPAQPGQPGQPPQGGQGGTPAKPGGPKPAAPAGGSATPNTGQKPTRTSAGNEGQSPGHDAAEATDTAASKPPKAGKGGKGKAKAGKASKSALTNASAARHQARRDRHVQEAVGHVSDRLTSVVRDLTENRTTMPEALDASVAVLADGYRRVMTRAAQDARRDHHLGSKAVWAALAKDDGDEEDGDEEEYDPVIESDANSRAEGQRSYLIGLLGTALALGAISDALSNRIDLYGNSLNGAYNAAYGTTVRTEGGDTYQVIWHVGAAEHCKLCLDRDGQVFTFHSLPGWPGDGEFGGICLGGPNCKCSLEYVQGGATQGSFTNEPQDTGYYQQQLADITARRDEAEAAREEFLATVPEAARARAQNRDDIRDELAAHANARIRATGGYGGISVEPPDIPAGDVAHRVLLGASKSKAVFSELAALQRHLNKGRLLSSWAARHVEPTVLARIAEHMAKGMDAAAAIHAATAARRVTMDGVELWVAGPGVTDTAFIPAGGGGFQLLPHDGDGIQFDPADGRVDVQPSKPKDGTGSGQTASATTRASEPEGDDAAQPGRRGLPPTNAQALQGPGSASWPSGGIGTAVPGVGKGSVDPQVILDQLSANYPPDSISWVKDASWVGPVDVPKDQIDLDDRESWAATHQRDRVEHFVHHVQDGRKVHPAVMVQVPGDDHRKKVVDGHHRTLAYLSLGQDVPAYVGTVPAGDDRWEETHSSQVHQGADPANKGDKTDGPVAAGIVVRAEDTGRILMLQRALTDDDPAGGSWEFPGGRLEDGEDPFDAARREWSEETGMQLPDGKVTGMWGSSNGVYQGFVWTVPEEAEVPVFDGRDEVDNPDDPDGEAPESIAWWDIDHLKDNPAVRTELSGDLERVLNALKGGK